MKVQAVKCPDCKVILWSRVSRDTHECDCGGLTITGGPSNPWVFGEYAKNEHTVFDEIELDDVDPQVLYNDWAEGICEYGKLYEVDDDNSHL